MELGELVKGLDLEQCSEHMSEKQEFKNVYICDLLSNVMGHASADDIWITIQTHQNIVAVASLLNIPAIIIPEGLKPDQDTVAKANSEHITIFSSPLSAYLLGVKIYHLLNNVES